MPDTLPILSALSQLPKFSQTELAEAVDKKNAEEKSSFDWGFLPSVFTAIPQITGQFNGKFQNNQLAIAEANARAAEAQAQASTAQPRNNTIAWVAAIIAILIIAYLLINKK